MRETQAQCMRLDSSALPIKNADLLRTCLRLRKMERKDPPLSKLSYLCSEDFSEDGLSLQEGRT